MKEFKVGKTGGVMTHVYLGDKWIAMFEKAIDAHKYVWLMNDCKTHFPRKATKGKGK